MALQSKEMGMLRAPLISVTDARDAGNFSPRAAAMLAQGLPSACEISPGEVAELHMHPVESPIHIVTNYHTSPTLAARFDRDLHDKMLQQGRGFLSVVLCGFDNIGDFEAARVNRGTGNHLILNVKYRSCKSLIDDIRSALTIRESLWTIPASELLPPKTGLDWQPRIPYGPVAEIDSRPPRQLMQVKVFITSDPRLENPRQLSFSIADRSGERTIHCCDDEELQWVWFTAQRFKAGDFYSLVIRCPGPELEPPKSNKLVANIHAIGRSVIQDWASKTRLIGRHLVEMREKKAYKGNIDDHDSPDPRRWSDEKRVGYQDQDDSLVVGVTDTKTLWMKDECLPDASKMGDEKATMADSSVETSRIYGESGGGVAVPMENRTRVYLLAYKSHQRNWWRLSSVPMD